MTNDLTSKQFLNKCVEWAKEKKATEILSIDLENITLIGDYFLLMSASNTRQAQAIADYIKEQADELSLPVLRTEGYDDARWILLDCGDVIVHIFQQEERQYYNLERLWGDAPITNY